jgi:hypothetical protein
MKQTVINSFKTARFDVFIWAFLIIFTLLSVWLGHGPEIFTNAQITVCILVVTFIKTRLIILHFMEIKHAPVPLRIIFEVWGIGACGLLIYLLLFNQ